jgi:antirestriction protein ArdC
LDGPSIATGPRLRLKRFGSEAYAVEELVAELGAAFLCADLDLALEPREDHASYIANWLQVLTNDNRAIFTAASHAQRAADYLHRLQSVEQEGFDRLLIRFMKRTAIVGGPIPREEVAPGTTVEVRARTA